LFRKHKKEKKRHRRRKNESESSAVDSDCQQENRNPQVRAYTPISNENDYVVYDPSINIHRASSQITSQAPSEKPSSRKKHRKEHSKQEKPNCGVQVLDYCLEAQPKQQKKQSKEKIQDSSPLLEVRKASKQHEKMLDEKVQSLKQVKESLTDLRSQANQMVQAIS
jgi:hypothetical protein